MQALKVPTNRSKHIINHSVWGYDRLKFDSMDTGKPVVDDSLDAFWSRYRPISSVDKPKAFIQWCFFSVNYIGVVFQIPGSNE